VLEATAYIMEIDQTGRESNFGTVHLDLEIPNDGYIGVLYNFLDTGYTVLRVFLLFRSSLVFKMTMPQFNDAMEEPRRKAKRSAVCGRKYYIS